MRTRHSIKYRTHDGSRELDFSDPPYVYKTHDLFSRGWTTEYSPLRGGHRYLTDAQVTPAPKSLDLQIIAKTRHGYNDALHSLAAIADYDLAVGRFGVLDFNGWCLECQLVDISPEAETLHDLTTVKLIIEPKTGVWYRERLIEWAEPSLANGEELKRYAHRYPYRYGTPNATPFLALGALGSAVTLRIWGPVRSPSVTIGNKTYTISSAISIAQGEVLTLDGRAKELYKTLPTGQRLNEFHHRKGGNFDRLPAGLHHVTKSGNFTAELVITDFATVPERWRE